MTDAAFLTGKPALALQLIALAFVRTGELRKLWPQIDWEEKIWAPAVEVMKMRRPHIVPLAPQAITVLEELRKLTAPASSFSPSRRA